MIVLGGGCLVWVFDDWLLGFVVLVYSLTLWFRVFCGVIWFVGCLLLVLL